MDEDLDLSGLARQGLVDRVVDDLVDEMVEPPLPGRADVHAGALANRFEALEDGDVLGVVGPLAACGVRLLLRQIVPFTHEEPPLGGSKTYVTRVAGWSAGTPVGGHRFPLQIAP